MVIFLVGFMGSGKSTLGRQMAAQQGLPLYDTDHEVQKAFGGLSISEIFAQYGEEAFREKEAEVLRAVPCGKAENAPSHDCIVVTGGGLPCHSDNMAWMLEHGRVIWLTADADTVFNRLKNREDRKKRPLLRGKSDEELRRFIEEKMREREVWYGLAHERRGTD